MSRIIHQDVRIVAAACDLLLPLPRAAAAEDRYGTHPPGLLVTRWNSTITQIPGLSAAGGLKVHPAMVNRWQQTLRNYDTTRYRQNGIRAVDEQQPALSCHIRHLSFSYKTGESYSNPFSLYSVTFHRIWQTVCSSPTISAQILMRISGWIFCAVRSLQSTGRIFTVDSLQKISTM